MESCKNKSSISKIELVEKGMKHLSFLTYYKFSVTVYEKYAIIETDDNIILLEIAEDSIMEVDGGQWV